MSQIDSLSAPDRKTHELIRLVCMVILRNPAGIQRHAMLAREVGPPGTRCWLDPSHDPGFGLLLAVEALSHAREDDAAPEVEADEDERQAGVPHPPRGSTSATNTSGGRSRPRAPLPPAPRVRLLDPPTRPDLPGVPQQEGAPEEVSGRATLHTFTINHQPWIPGSIFRM